MSTNLIPITLASHKYTYPASAEPEWSSKVDRWYQLDASAYGLVEICSRWKKEFPSSNPAVMLLASPGASNETDSDFALGGARNPMKFVHTLPNVRSAPVFQAIGWSGPLLCIQHDPTTIMRAIEEAAELYWEAPREIWILSVLRNQAEYASIIMVLGGPARGVYQLEKTERMNSDSKNQDQRLLGWLESNDTSQTLFKLLGPYEIRRA